MNRLMNRLFCAIFSHDYEVWQKFSPRSRRLICRRCCGDWGMNDDARAIIPWSTELQGMYESFGYPVHNPWSKP
jgi:hypothetical protein